MWTSYNTLIVLAGTGLLGANAGLVGSYAVLRGRALTGDALAHAALPGLCVAFLLFGQRSMPILLLGALVSGLLGVLVISALARFTRIKQDAAIGIVLSVFFGLGITLSGIIQKQSSEGSKAGLDSYILGKTAGILLQDVLWIGGVSLFSLLMIVLLYKEFKLTVFDAGFGRVQGWPVLALDLALMALVALSVIAGLPAVGVVLMAALLILPGASARFWTDHLGSMLLLAGLLGLAIGVLGTLMSARYSGMPAGPIIVLVGAAVFGLSTLFAPRRGVVAMAVARHRFRRELDGRTLVRLIHAALEMGWPDARGVAVRDIRAWKSWSPRRVDRLIRQAERNGHVRREDPGRVLLTPEGWSKGAELARSHRIWERFLHDHPELAPSLADLGAETVDDRLPALLVAELSRKVLEAGDWPRGATPPEDLS